MTFVHAWKTGLTVSIALGLFGLAGFLAGVLVTSIPILIYAWLSGSNVTDDTFHVAWLIGGIICVPWMMGEGHPHIAAEISKEISN